MTTDVVAVWPYEYISEYQAAFTALLGNLEHEVNPAPRCDHCVENELILHDLSLHDVHLYALLSEQTRKNFSTGIDESLLTLFRATHTDVAVLFTPV